MNELEYIPGDLVITNGEPLGTSKNVVYRVTSSDPSKILKLDDGTVLIRKHRRCGIWRERLSLRRLLCLG